ncbi:MAG: hypothetical protein ACK4JD_13445, partial [Thermoflexales bacterium]
ELPNDVWISQQDITFSDCVIQRRGAGVYDKLDAKIVRGSRSRGPGWSSKGDLQIWILGERTRYLVIPDAHAGHALADEVVTNDKEPGHKSQLSQLSEL